METELCTERAHSQVLGVADLQGQMCFDYEAFVDAPLTICLMAILTIEFPLSDFLVLYKSCLLRSSHNTGAYHPYEDGGYAYIYHH